MPVQLILIRHGIAEDRAPGADDSKRRLTGKGRQRLYETLPGLRPLISGGGKPVIWSSTLLRAQETAEIAADIFRAGKAVSRDFITDGYFNGLCSSVEELDDGDNRTIIVVGHEPDMSIWSQALSGSPLPFKKGAAAAFTYHTGSPDTSELEWFFQPDGMEKINAENESSDILSGFRKELTGHMEQLLLARDRFLSNPDDPETAHQLRVSIRKLRSLLSFLRPYQKNRINSAVQASLKKYITEFSYLRELDVLRESCDAFSREHPDVLAAGSDIFSRMKKERAKEAKRAVSAALSEEYTVSLDEADKALQGSPWKKYIDEDKSIEASITGRFLDMFHVFEQAASDVDYSDAAATHTLRIEAKKLRYILDSLASLTGNKYGIIGAELREAHTGLGEICDARRNAEILGNFDSRGLPAKTRREFQAVIAYQKEFLQERLNSRKILNPRKG